MAVGSCIYFIFVVTLHALLIDVTIADCRVLADCDGGQPQWRRLSQGQAGPPGKRVRNARLTYTTVHISKPIIHNFTEMLKIIS